MTDESDSRIDHPHGHVQPWLFLGTEAVPGDVQDVLDLLAELQDQCAVDNAGEKTD